MTVAVTACSSSGPLPTGASRTTPKVDLCANTLQPVPAGATNGRQVGTINQGRILIAVEAAGAGSPCVYRCRRLPRGPDGTGRDAAQRRVGPRRHDLFDNERAGGRHLFRIATDGSGLTQVTKEAGTPKSTRRSHPTAAGSRTRTTAASKRAISASRSLRLTAAAPSL